MSKLSMIDCYVLGALVAKTNNDTEPFIISKRELFLATGLEGLQITLSLRKLHSAQLLVVIWFGDEAHIQINRIFPELLKASIVIKEEAA